MQNFTDFLNETYVNLIGNDPKKDDHKHEVHAMLSKSYEKIGGLIGGGFKSPDDMKNIPMWKLAKKDGKVKAAIMYKDKGGRKSVAVGTDGSEEGKHHLAKMMSADMMKNRAYSEKSGPSLGFLKKNLPDGHLNKIAHTYDHVEKTSDEPIRRPPADDPEIARHPELKDHFYQRKVGDHWHTKLRMGAMGKTIK